MLLPRSYISLLIGGGGTELPGFLGCKSQTGGIDSPTRVELLYLLVGRVPESTEWEVKNGICTKKKIITEGNMLVNNTKDCFI